MADRAGSWAKTCEEFYINIFIKNIYKIIVSYGGITSRSLPEVVVAMAELRSSHTGLEEVAAAAAGVLHLTFLVQNNRVMQTPFSKSQFKAVGI